MPIGPYAVGRNVVGSTEDLRGDIAEVLVYDRRLASLEERQRVFQYLANKWSVAMPKAANSWTRVGPLGTTPKQINAHLPLSDQGNVGQWRLDPRFCDDFDGATLDASRWHVNNAIGTESLGRKPALFKPDNAYLSDGSNWISPWRLASDFHVYGFDWQPDTLRWYVDGVLVREAKNTVSAP